MFDYRGTILEDGEIITINNYNTGLLIAIIFLS